MKTIYLFITYHWGDEGLRRGSDGQFCGSGHGLDTFLYGSVRFL